MEAPPARNLHQPLGGALVSTALDYAAIDARSYLRSLKFARWMVPSAEPRACGRLFGATSYVANTSEERALTADQRRGAHPFVDTAPLADGVGSADYAGHP